MTERDVSWSRTKLKNPLPLVRRRVKQCFTQTKMVEVNVIRSITDTEIYQVTQVYHSVVVLFSLQMHR